MDNFISERKHTLDAPNDVAREKAKKLLKELGITDKDIEAIGDDI